MVGDVRRPDRLVAGFQTCGQQRFRVRSRVRSCPVGSYDDVDDRAVGAFQAKRVSRAVDGAALGFEVGADLQRDALLSVAVQGLVCVAVEGDTRVRGCRGSGEHAVPNREGEGQGSRPIRGQLDCDQAMRVGREHLAGEADFVLYVGARDEARVQVQRPPVVLGRNHLVREGELYFGQGQVGAERRCPAREMLGGEPLRFGVVAREEEFADARDLLPGGRVQVCRGRAARPCRRLGELDPLPVGAAVDHAAQTAVADGEGFEPAGGGAVVAEDPGWDADIAEGLVGESFQHGVHLQGGVKGATHRATWPGRRRAARLRRRLRGPIPRRGGV